MALTFSTPSRVTAFCIQSNRPCFIRDTTVASSSVPLYDQRGGAACVDARDYAGLDPFHETGPQIKRDRAETGEYDRCAGRHEEPEHPGQVGRGAGHGRSCPLTRPMQRRRCRLRSWMGLCSSLSSSRHCRARAARVCVVCGASRAVRLRGRRTRRFPDRTPESRSEPREHRHEVHQRRRAVRTPAPVRG